MPQRDFLPVRFKARAHAVLYRAGSGGVHGSGSSPGGHTLQVRSRQGSHIVAARITAFLQLDRIDEAEAELAALRSLESEFVANAETSLEEAWAKRATDQKPLGPP